MLVTDIHERYDENDVIEKLKKTESPAAVLINKIDKSTEEEVKSKIAYWEETLHPQVVFAISTLHGHNIAANKRSMLMLHCLGLDYGQRWAILKKISSRSY